MPASLQAKALAAQQKDFLAAAAADEASNNKLVDHLQSMQQLLFGAQSVKFLEIRQREAEAFQVGQCLRCPLNAA